MKLMDILQARCEVEQYVLTIYRLFKLWEGTIVSYYLVYVTVLRKNGLITGLAKIVCFFPEMASTKLRYCLSKI